MEQTNQKVLSQVSDSSEIHGMTLQYSDDEFTDKEMRQLNLQAAAHQRMMEQDAQQPTTPLPFQQPQDPVQTQAKRNLGTDEGILDLEALQNLLQMTTAQIKYAAKRRNQNFKPVKSHDFKVGDLVLVRNHTSKAFQEKYQDSFQVIRLLGKNQLEVKDQKGHLRQVHITDVKKTTMPEVTANAVPDYTQFGRATKLRLNPNKVEDLQWTIPGEFTTP